MCDNLWRFLLISYHPRRIIMVFSGYKIYKRNIIELFCGYWMLNYSWYFILCSMNKLELKGLQIKGGNFKEILLIYLYIQSKYVTWIENNNYLIIHLYISYFRTGHYAWYRCVHSNSCRSPWPCWTVCCLVYSCGSCYCMSWR